MGSSAKSAETRIQIQDLISEYKENRRSLTDTVRLLYTLLNRRVIFMLKLFGIDSREDQDDLLMELFTKLLESSLDSYDPSRGKFLLWLDAITHNLAIDHLKRMNRHARIFPSLQREEDPTEGGWSLDEFPSPTNQARVILTAIDVEYLMGHISDRDRLLLFQRYCDGFSIAELAEHHNTSERNIRFWIQRSLRKLLKVARGNKKDPPGPGGGKPPGDRGSGNSGVTRSVAGWRSTPQSVVTIQGAKSMIRIQSLITDLFRFFRASEIAKISPEREEKNRVRLEAVLADFEARAAGIRKVENEDLPKARSQAAGKLFGVLLLLLTFGTKAKAALLSHAAISSPVFSHTIIATLLLAVSAGVGDSLHPLHEAPPPVFVNGSTANASSEDPSTVASLNNLARLYCIQGRYEQAEPLYQLSSEGAYAMDMHLGSVRLLNPGERLLNVSKISLELNAWTIGPTIGGIQINIHDPRPSSATGEAGGYSPACIAEKNQSFEHIFGFLDQIELRGWLRHNPSIPGGVDRR
jgi:RNA polymerase sigma factor (sigma-70 family)